MLSRRDREWAAYPLSLLNHPASFGHTEFVHLPQDETIGSLETFDLVSKAEEKQNTVVSPPRPRIAGTVARP